MSANWKPCVALGLAVMIAAGCGRSEPKEEAIPDGEPEEQTVPDATPDAAPSAYAPAVEDFGETPVEVMPQADVKAIQVSADGLLKYLLAARENRDRLSMALMSLSEADQERVRGAKLDARAMLGLLGAPSLKPGEYSVGAVSKIGERMMAEATLLESGKPVAKRLFFVRSGFRWQAELFLSALTGPAAAVPNATYARLEEVADKALLLDIIDVLAAAEEVDMLGGFGRALIAGAAKAGDEDAADRMLDSLNRVPPSVQGMFAKALARIGGNRSLAAVVALLDHADESVSTAAFEALCAWQGEEAAKPLLELADKDEARREAALKGYVAVADQVAAKTPDKALAMLREAFQRAQADETKRAVVAALGNVSSPAALKEARKHLADDELAGTAGRSVFTIAGNIWRTSEKEAVSALQALAKESKDNRLVRDVNGLLSSIDKAKKEQAGKK